MNAFLVCGLIFCLSPLTFSLKCFECGGEEGSCNNDANVKTIDCQAFMDRCMTMVITSNVQNVGPITQEMKNCSHSSMCPDQSQGNPCTQLASKPDITECKVTCCQGNLCNKVTSPGSTEPPSAGVPEFTATFGAIFLGCLLSSMAALG